MNASSDLQATLDASRKSWIEAANDPACDFSIQNLPFGIFSDARNSARRVGVAIGDSIVDLAVLQTSGLLRLPGTRTDAVRAQQANRSSLAARLTISSPSAATSGAACGSS